MGRSHFAFLIPFGLSLLLNWVVQLTFTGEWANLFTALGIFAVAGLTAVISGIVFSIWRGKNKVFLPVLLGVVIGFGINWIWTKKANETRKEEKFKYLRSPYKNADSIVFTVDSNAEWISMEMVSKTKVEAIYVSSNRIKTLPPGLIEVENLKELRLARTDSLDLNQAFDIISQLDLSELHLVVISAEYLPAKIAELKTLLKLNLSANKNLDLDSLFNLLAKLPQLRELEIRNLTKTHLPSNIRDLPKLRSLDLGSGQFTDLPTSLMEMDSLQILNLIKNPVSKNWWERLDSTKVDFKVIE